MSIHEAARKGNLAQVKENLKVSSFLSCSGYLVNSRNRHGLTPLHVAAAWGQVEVMGYLLTEGANVDAEDKMGSTPLFQAVAYDHIKAVKILLSAVDPIVWTKNGRG